VRSGVGAGRVALRAQRARVRSDAPCAAAHGPAGAPRATRRFAALTGRARLVLALRPGGDGAARGEASHPPGGPQGRPRRGARPEGRSCGVQLHAGGVPGAGATADDAARGRGVCGRWGACWGGGRCWEGFWSRRVCPGNAQGHGKTRPGAGGVKRQARAGPRIQASPPPHPRPKRLGAAIILVVTRLRPPKRPRSNASIRPAAPAGSARSATPPTPAGMQQPAPGFDHQALVRGAAEVSARRGGRGPTRAARRAPRRRCARPALRRAPCGRRRPRGWRARRGGSFRGAVPPPGGPRARSARAPDDA
jgi:hypothetical protein